MEDHDILTTQEAAKLLRIHENTIKRLAAARRVPCRKVGRLYRFSRRALEEWIAHPAATTDKRRVLSVVGQ